MLDTLWIRVSIGIILAAGFGISGYHRRKAAIADPTARRRDECLGTKILRLSVALPAFGVLLGGLFAPEFVRWASFDAPLGVRLAGLGIAALGVPLATWLFPHLGKNVTATTLTKQTHELVTTGPYAYVRHPLYLAGMLLLGGAGLALGNWMLLVMVAGFFVAWMTIIIPKEEAALEERFGDDYRAYRKRTGALLPCL